jgi:transcriptional regulator GlxA family with amidase domain
MSKTMSNREFVKAFEALKDASETPTTQREMAEVLGIDPRTLRRYLDGELPVPQSLALVMRLALLHGYSASTLAELR